MSSATSSGPLTLAQIYTAFGNLLNCEQIDIVNPGEDVNLVAQEKGFTLGHVPIGKFFKKTLGPFTKKENGSAVECPSLHDSTTKQHVTRLVCLLYCSAQYKRDTRSASDTPSYILGVVSQTTVVLQEILVVNRMLFNCNSDALKILHQKWVDEKFDAKKRMESLGWSNTVLPWPEQFRSIAVHPTLAVSSHAPPALSTHHAAPQASAARPTPPQTTRPTPPQTARPAAQPAASPQVVQRLSQAPPVHPSPVVNEPDIATIFEATVKGVQMNRRILNDFIVQELDNTRRHIDPKRDHKEQSVVLPHVFNPFVDALIRFYATETSTGWAYLAYVLAPTDSATDRVEILNTYIFGLTSAQLTTLTSEWRIKKVPPTEQIQYMYSRYIRTQPTLQSRDSLVLYIQRDTSQNDALNAQIAQLTHHKDSLEKELQKANDANALKTEENEALRASLQNAHSGVRRRGNQEDFAADFAEEQDGFRRLGEELAEKTRAAQPPSTLSKFTDLSRYAFGKVASTVSSTVSSTAVTLASAARLLGESTRTSVDKQIAHLQNELDSMAKDNRSLVEDADLQESSYHQQIKGLRNDLIRIAKDNKLLIESANSHKLSNEIQIKNAKGEKWIRMAAYNIALAKRKNIEIATLMHAVHYKVLYKKKVDQYLDIVKQHGKLQAKFNALKEELNSMKDSNKSSQSDDASSEGSDNSESDRSERSSDSDDDKVTYEELNAKYEELQKAYDDLEAKHELLRQDFADTKSQLVHENKRNVELGNQVWDVARANQVGQSQKPISTHPHKWSTQRGGNKSMSDALSAIIQQQMVEINNLKQQIRHRTQSDSEDEQVDLFGQDDDVDRYSDEQVGSKHDAKTQEAKTTAIFNIMYARMV